MPHSINRTDDVPGNSLYVQRHPAFLIHFHWIKRKQKWFNWSNTKTINIWLLQYIVYLFFKPCRNIFPASLYKKPHQITNVFIPNIRLKFWREFGAKICCSMRIVLGNVFINVLISAVCINWLSERIEWERAAGISVAILRKKII